MWLRGGCEAPYLDSALFRRASVSMPAACVDGCGLRFTCKGKYLVWRVVESRTLTFGGLFHVLRMQEWRQMGAQKWPGTLAKARQPYIKSHTHIHIYTHTHANTHTRHAHKHAFDHTRALTHTLTRVPRTRSTVRSTSFFITDACCKEKGRGGVKGGGGVVGGGGDWGKAI
jgi:hypothetical protein